MSVYATRVCHGTILVLTILVCLGAAGTAGAADDVGLWFDAGYSDNTSVQTTSSSIVEMYLVLSRPSLDGVGGWECKVVTDGPAQILTWDLEGLAVNFENPPSFTVGLGAPLPVGQDVLLATAQVMVGDGGPTSFSLVPTYHASIPDNMSYIPFDDPNVLTPMFPGTGTPEVAWIERAEPICLVSPVLDFGDRPVAVESVDTLFVRNVGGGTLHVQPVLTGDTSVFRLPETSVVSVAAGDSAGIAVGFRPPAYATYAATLSLGDGCPGIAVTGTGREAVPGLTVTPASIAFGDVVETTADARLVEVANTGEVPLDLAPAFGAGCDAFRATPSDPFHLEPGEARNLVVAFSPPTIGDYACDLAFSDQFPPLAMTGTGVPATVAWRIVPDSLGFGQVAVGTETVERTILVMNEGDWVPTLSLALDDPAGVFSIVAPADHEFLAPPGEEFRVVIGFTPNAEADFTGRLALGGRAPDVPLTGTGAVAAPGCAAAPASVDFGTIFVGQSRRATVTVTNTGNTVLALAPSQCADFAVSVNPLSVDPGGHATVIVDYAPTAAGVSDCILDLGPDACTPLPIHGEAVSPDVGGSAVAGVSFGENEYQPFDTVAAATLFPAYIVLMNPSYDAGVYGWELGVQLDPGLILAAATVRGAAVNLLDPPEFLVGLSTPLPDASMVVLAELQLITLDSTAKAIRLGPVSTPTIPGHMAWAYNSDYDVAVMDPLLISEDAVAWVNGQDIVGLAAPAPTARLVDGRVELTWPIPTDGADGCHLYRTVAGRETRLTGTPLRPSGNGYLYTDDPAGLPAGTEVDYSYAIVSGAAEIARSPQTRVELPEAAVVATRLLANRPNPFNPETEIRFETAAAGHVRIAVYDVTGRRVAVLEDGDRAAGPHQVTWRGRDAAGRAVPSGAYYVRLETATGRDTRKVMLLK